MDSTEYASRAAYAYANAVDAYRIANAHTHTESEHVREFGAHLVARARQHSLVYGLTMSDVQRLEMDVRGGRRNRVADQLSELFDCVPPFLSEPHAVL